MKSIGIIANPNSGKDIRRLYSYALTIGNNEKANLMERMILGAQDLGVEEIFIMPDHHNIGNNILSTLKHNNDLKANIKVLDFKPLGNEKDTIQATKMFKDHSVDCIIVLGGDGTSRLVASVKTNIPIIPISTGTNNVYPDFHEGTTVGMAAAVVCSFGVQEEYIYRDKIIEIYKNGQVVDYALVDVGITNQPFIGNRAIEKIGDIDELIVSRSHPASIGFSSVIGVQAISKVLDDFGFRAKFNTELTRSNSPASIGGGFQRAAKSSMDSANIQWDLNPPLNEVSFNRGSSSVLAPFTPGKMTPVRMEAPVKMDLDEMYVTKPDSRGSISLDGERTLHFEEGELLGFVIRRKGPLRVNVEAALEYGVREGFFSRNR